MTDFAAVDLGAESGRVVRGSFDGERVALEVAHRFQNRPVRLPDGLHWNLLALFTEAVDGLRGLDVQGVGVDTWGVDYALLDGEGGVLGLPFHYRDSRTEGMIARADERVPPAERYEVTGIQTMPINTVYQLLADSRAAAAERIALVPDLLAYWLCGELANEATNASTTGLLDARSGTWARGLIERLGLPAAPFAGDPVEAGTTLGPVHSHHGVDAPVHAVASHDTASAFAAAPVAQRERRDPVLGHVVAARARARRARADRPCARFQPHQRARGRRHDPSAPQRDGAVAGPGVPPPLGRLVRRAARPGRAGARRRSALRPRRRPLPAPGGHARADRRRVHRGRAGGARGPRRDRPLRAHLARLQVPARARAPRAGHRPGDRGHSRDRRGRAERPALPPDRRPARAPRARRPGRGDGARQRARPGARDR